MEKDYMNKLITMSDDNQYVILDEIQYDGNTYALANEVIDDNLGSDITLFRVERINGEFNFIVETNLDIVQQVLLNMA